MPKIRQMALNVGRGTSNAKINWYPMHMHNGLKAMIGKLRTVDCIVEVHDARIPLIGRNKEFRDHLGLVKPRLLVLNKSDLADLSRWDDIKRKLEMNGDKHVVLTDLSGANFSQAKKGYNSLLQKTIDLINESDRHNRASLDHFKVMIVGIPNVGKSTLINRLRQYHLGRGGEVVRTGNMAGVTRHVEEIVRICSRPLIYSLDTPGVLEPHISKNPKSALKLALCSTINDSVLQPDKLVDFLLQHLNKTENFTYQHYLGFDRPVENSLDLYKLSLKNIDLLGPRLLGKSADKDVQSTTVFWRFLKLFRDGYFGKIMFY